MHSEGDSKTESAEVICADLAQRNPLDILKMKKLSICSLHSIMEYRPRLQRAEMPPYENAI